MVPLTEFIKQIIVFIVLKLSRGVKFLFIIEMNSNKEPSLLHVFVLCSHIINLKLVFHVFKLFGILGIYNLKVSTEMKYEQQ